VKNRFLVPFSVALFGVALFSGVDIAGQSTAGSLQGVWQTVEVNVTGPGARTIAIAEPRPNLMIMTPRHYSRVAVQAETPRPIVADLGKATAEELRTVWGPFNGEAGTYEVRGDVITMRPIAAKNPAAMIRGAFTAYTFRMDGDTIWITEQRNQNGPFLNPVTVKAVRVE
jgi:hypothetical protein